MPNETLPLPSGYLKDLDALIALDTQNPPGNETIAAHYVAERLRVLGATDVRIVEMAPGRGNVLGTFRFGPGPTLLYNSHLDVVPAQVPELLQPRSQNGQVLGRGACDAKGAIVAMLAACERLTQNAAGLGGTLLFTAVADEEMGGAGARQLLEQGLTADVAMVGEPTENQIHLGARGVYQARVHFQGKAAHSSDPSKGLNAIYGAARFVLAVEQWNHDLKSLPMSPVVSANVIEGGTKTNIIPDHCVVEVDRRLTPAETVADGERELLGRLNDVLTEELGLRWSVEPMAGSRTGFNLEPTHPWAQLALSLRGQTEPGFFRAGTDASFLVDAGIPSFILGPGSLDQAHVADEYVEVAALAEAASLYEQIARRYLGGA